LVFLYMQGHSLSSHLTDEQRSEMKAYMSLVNSVFVNAVVCYCIFTSVAVIFVLKTLWKLNPVLIDACCLLKDVES